MSRDSRVAFSVVHTENFGVFASRFSRKLTDSPLVSSGPADYPLPRLAPYLILDRASAAILEAW